MSVAKMQAARELIDEKYYDEARAILKTVSDPKALQWLEKINRITPQQEIHSTKRAEKVNQKKEIIVTTGDIKEEYEIIGPVYFQVSNKGIFSSDYSRLEKLYRQQIEKLIKEGQLSEKRADWGFLYGEFTVGQNKFDTAFYIAVQEIKQRALKIGADAIIGMRQDIDLDATGYQFFYMQMYGTAVKLT